MYKNVNFKEWKRRDHLAMRAYEHSFWALTTQDVKFIHDDYNDDGGENVDDNDYEDDDEFNPQNYTKLDS